MLLNNTLPIINKYYNALNYFNKGTTSDNLQIYNLLKKIGEPKYIIDSQPKSLACLLIGSIVGQKISFTKARNIRSNIYTLFGTEFNLNDIYKLNINIWKKLGLEIFQIETLLNVFDLYKSGKIKDDNIYDINNWSQIKGIGVWTLNNIKIMYQVTNYKTVPDIILENDYIVKKCFLKIYNWKTLLKKNINSIKLEWIDDKSGESYIGIIHWYLWRYGKNNIY